VSNAVVAIGALDRATLPTADDAAQFVAGDPVVVSKTTGGGGNVQENAVVDRVSGTTVYFTTSLRNDYNPGSLIFVLAPMTQQFRAINAAKLAVGSIVTLTQQGTNPLTTVVTGVRAQRISPTLTTYAVSVKDAISGFTLGPTSDITLQSEEFSLTVAQGTTYSKTYPPMSMSQGHPSYYVSVINSDPTGLVFVKPYDGPNGPNTTALPRNRPSTSAPQNLDGGVNHDPSQITPNDYAMALHSLESHKDINIVVAADRTDQDVQQRVLTHCTSMKDRFAIFDAQKGTTLQTYNAQRAWLESDKGFAALYYPWLSVTSAKTNLPILVPPSGFVAGIYARTDSGRGVFKAPAGTEAIVSGALGVELTVSDVDQGVLNLNGVNVIRVFQRGGRPLVWGARTTTTNTNWQYVNIRRLFLYLEGSIQQGIRGAVFEPNNLELWQKLKRTISAFLTQQWRDGALFGQSEKDAFYVRIDDVLNPPDQRALGKLTVEIGVKPSYPAEFIVVRIGIWQGGSDVTE
jgi:phage tail sheath protein FI